MAAPVYTVLFFGSLDMRVGDLVTVYDGWLTGSHIVARRLVNETRGTNVTSPWSSPPGGIGWSGTQIEAPIRGYVDELDVSQNRTAFKLFEGAPHSGSKQADGTEQTLHEGSYGRQVEGYIFLSEMEAGDTLVVRQYVQEEENGDYELYAEETYSGPQSSPALYITPKRFSYGGKITIKQTTGDYKNFKYLFTET